MLKRCLIVTVLATLYCYNGQAQHQHPHKGPGNHQEERIPDRAYFDTEWRPGTHILKSEDRRYTLDFQKDGNLVLKDGNHLIWDTKTFDRRPKNLVFQKDGNLVIYDFDDRPIWASDSNNRHGDCLFLKNDGNLVIYTRDQHAVWDIHTKEKPDRGPGHRP